MEEFFLEDVLEKTGYQIQSESDNYQGNSRRRRRQQESKKDPLTEVFEACFNPLIGYVGSYLFSFTIFPTIFFF